MKRSKFSLDFDNDLTMEATSKVDANKLDAFAKGALDHSTAVDLTKGWRGEDRYADPSLTTTLRLNAYESGLVKEVAKKQSRSINSLIRVVLVQELEKLL